MEELEQELRDLLCKYPNEDLAKYLLNQLELWNRRKNYLETPVEVNYKPQE